MDKVKTGEMIKRARTEKGYTQAELGALVNVTNKAVSRWEKGEAFPDVSVLEQLANVLGLRIQDLVTGEKESDIEDAVTEIAREVRIQQKEKRRILYKKLIVAAGFVLLACYSIPVFSGRSLHFPVGFPLYIQPAFLLGFVYYAIRTREIQKPFTCKRSGWFTAIGIFMGMFMIIVDLAAVLYIPGRKTVFGLEPRVVGPVLLSMFVIPFIVSLLFITIEAITENIHYGFFVLIFDMFLALSYGGLLYNMESAAGILRAIIFSTIILLAEMLVVSTLLPVLLRLSLQKR